MNEIPRIPAPGGDDPRIELMHKVARLESQYADRVDETETGWMTVVNVALDRWRTSWQEQTSTPELNPELSRKFRVCFPLAAHALNHVEAAVTLHSSSPWVAMSCVRIAFEHALTAQWVLWTKDGEDLLAQQMSLQDHRRSSEFIDAVVRAAADTPNLAESAAQLSEDDELLLHVLISRRAYRIEQSHDIGLLIGEADGAITQIECLGNGSNAALRHPGPRTVTTF